MASWRARPVNQFPGGRGDPFSFASRPSAPAFNPAELAAAPPQVNAPRPTFQSGRETMYGGSKDTPYRNTPGQAQPIAPQSQGTPYQPQQPPWAGQGGYNPGWGVMQAQPPQMPTMAPPNQVTDMQYRGNIPIPKGAPQSVVDYMTKNPDMWTRGQPARPPREPESDYMPLPVRPSPVQPPAQVPTPQEQPPSYQQPANGTSRTDPGSGKMVTYKNGQWQWEPNPISGPQPYDTSRFGDGTPPGPGGTLPKAGQAQPIQPPSQGTPYGQPADPYAVNDLKSLPFYKSLRVGDKVRKRESGQYDVYDSSGVAVETYNPGRTEPSVSMKRAREPLFLHQNEGMTSQQLGDIQAQREKDAKQKAAADAWIKGAPARLEKEREARRNSPTGKQAQARIDQMQAEVANLERNLSKGSLSDKNAKLKRIRELKGQIASTVIR